MLKHVPTFVFAAVVYAIHATLPQYEGLVTAILSALGVAAPSLLLTKSPLDK